MREDELEEALSKLRLRCARSVSDGFEQQVWAKIAKATTGQSWVRLFALSPSWLAPALVVAVVIGIASGTSRALPEIPDDSELAIFSAETEVAPLAAFFQ